MKLKTLIAALTFMMLSPWAEASELYLNFFRNPSIGPELKFGYVSIHTGYYTTIISKNSDGDNVSTEFVRSGVTFWPKDYLYVSASHLLGLTRERKDKNFAMYEAGFQALVWENKVALRLGVAVIPESEGFETQVNPTPGLSLHIPFN